MVAPASGAALLPTETQNECRREIAVEIPADVVDRAFDATLAKYQKLARLPGFRRGKVPPGILKQRFAEDIKSEVVESLVPTYFKKEAEKQRLTPISQPRVTDLHVESGQPLRFKAAFEVMPEVEVAGYKELRAEKSDTSVSDDEVQEALDRLREQHASYAAVEEDRGLSEGDFAQVELHGTPKAEDGVGAGDSPAISESAETKSAGGSPASTQAAAAESGNSPVHLEEVLVEVGGSNTVREFSENLRGAKAGEERTFDVTYPDDFKDQRLAGKTFTYTLSVKGIKRKNMPALDDDFAREVSNDFQSVEQLRERVREGLAAEKKHQAEHSAKDKIVEELVRRNEFPLPEALVEHQIDVRLERGLRALAAQGMRAEQMRTMDFDRLRAGQREAARREVQTSIILEKIADAENVQVTNEELDGEIEAVAQQSKQTVESIRARLTKDGAIERIRQRLRNDKVLDWLYEKSSA